VSSVVACREHRAPVGAANLIRKVRPDVGVALKGSGGGIFEIRIGDRVACSKKALGRFPTDAEVVGVVT
jgi:hypothetical protein